MDGIETKSFKIDLRTRSGKKKLAKLIEAGWTVASQSERGGLTFTPHHTDVVLTRINRHAAALESKKREDNAAQFAAFEEARDKRQQQKALERLRLSATPGGAHVAKAQTLLSFREMMASSKLRGPSQVLFKCLEKGRAPDVATVLAAREQLQSIDDVKLHGLVEKLLIHVESLDTQYLEAPSVGSETAQSEDGTPNTGTASLPTESVTSSPADAGGHVSEQLARLAELHRSGDLSDHEFEMAKVRVLGLQAQ